MTSSDQIQRVDQDALAISRVAKFVLALDGYVTRLSAVDPSHPRLQNLTVTLSDAKLLLLVAATSD